MKNNNVFLVFDKEAYFYKYENKCLYPFKRKTFFYRLIIKLCIVFKVSIPIYMLNSQVLKSNNIVITDSTFSYGLYYCLKNKVGKKNLALYYMNTIDDSNKHLLNYFDNVYTFDIFDARKYNIKYKHTPYSSKIIKEEVDIVHDVFFLGRAKDRAESILNLKKELDHLEIRNKFLILDLNEEHDESKIDKFVSYDEYLKMVYQSKCMVEINKMGQVGCSLRFLEALFFKKKIITNNANIIEDPYYNYSNVYILGMDKRDLREFINEPYKENNGVNLKELYFENWIETF